MGLKFKVGDRVRVWAGECSSMTGKVVSIKRRRSRKVSYEIAVDQEFRYACGAFREFRALYLEHE